MILQHLTCYSSLSSLKGVAPSGLRNAIRYFATISSNGNHGDSTSSAEAGSNKAALDRTTCVSNHVHESELSDPDMPSSDMVNPYDKPPKKCVLCLHNIEPDYKNVQLLSQFVSPHTGRIYDNTITGLCVPMHRRVQRLVRRARVFGFMPFFIKDPVFLNEPRLFDAFRPKRVPPSN